MKAAFVLFLILSSPLSFSQNSLRVFGSKSCSIQSKDPRCWQDDLTAKLFKGKLSCSYGAKVYWQTFHGEGSGCGESGKTIIKSQSRNWATKTIYITTAWLPGSLNPDHYPSCHYWGPIYGGGEVNTFIGQWKVIVDGKEVGSYTFSEENIQESADKSQLIRKCSVGQLSI